MVTPESVTSLPVGTAPTGRRVEFTGITIIRISDGRIAEDWTSYDALGMIGNWV